MGTFVNTPFGRYEVMSNNEPIRSPASEQVTQSEFHRLERAWNNIEQNRGLRIEFDSSLGSERERTQARAEFRQLLIDGMTNSRAFREMITHIAEDQRPGHAVTVVLCRGVANVPIDLQRSNRVDLADIARLPVNPTPIQPNAITQREVVLHFLAERQYRAFHGLPLDRNTMQWAHEQGINAQNKLRDERGQERVHTQTITVDSSGRPHLEVQLWNHEHQSIPLKPGDHSPAGIPPVRDQQHLQPNQQSDSSTRFKVDSTLMEEPGAGGPVHATTDNHASPAKTFSTDSWDPSQSDDQDADGYASWKASQGGYDFDFDPSGKGTSYSSEHDPSLKPGPYAAEYDYGPSDKSRAYIVDYPDYDYDPSAKATAYGIDYDPSKVTLDPGETYTGGGKVDYSGTHDAKPDGGSGDGTTDWWGQKH